MSIHALHRQQIENYYGKPFDQITIDELVAFKFEGPEINFDDYVDNEPLIKEKPIKFELHSLKDFAVLQTQQWFIKGILPRAELAIVYGAPGSGKSFAVLDMMMAIARNNGSWCDFKVKPGKVTYICAEAPSGFRNRLVAYFNRHGIDPTIPKFSIIDDAPSLMLHSDVKMLCERIGKTDIIVVDTLARTLTGGDENNGKDMSLMIRHCQDLSHATGALVVLIHHSGKDADKGSRGWSGLLGATDAEIKVEHIGTDRSITITKQKDGESGKKIGFMLVPIVLGVDEDGDDITSCTFEQSFAEPNAYENKQDKLGGVQKIIMDCFDKFPEKPVLVDDLLSMTIAQMSFDPHKRDERRKRFFQSLESLQTKEILSVAHNLIYRF